MKKIRIGSVGLGRLGLQHAKNIASKISGAELTALCDMDEKKLKETAEILRVPHTFTRFDDMARCSDLDAVVVVSSSAFHPEHIETALDNGKHVFSEKPLGVDVEGCKRADKAVERHPDKVCMIGFMRRFDPSYLYVKEKIDNGEIGRPVLVRCYSQDPEKFIDGAISFAPTSGGIFLDMAVHDIDLARWFIGTEPVSAWAIGGCYAHPEFAQYKDGDNVGCLLKFKDDTMCFLFAGRTAPHGYNVETEIIGTKGILRIASVPQKNLVEILDIGGVRRECSQNFLERFEQAYLREIEEFVSCIVEHKKPSVTVYDGTRTLEIAAGCRDSFQSGELYRFENSI